MSAGDRARAFRLKHELAAKEEQLAAWIRAFGHLQAAVHPGLLVDIDHPEAMAQACVAHLAQRLANPDAPPPPLLCTCGSKHGPGTHAPSCPASPPPAGGAQPEATACPHGGRAQRRVVDDDNHCLCCGWPLEDDEDGRCAACTGRAPAATKEGAP